MNIVFPEFNDKCDTCGKLPDEGTYHVFISGHGCIAQPKTTVRFRRLPAKFRLFNFDTGVPIVEKNMSEPGELIMPAFDSFTREQLENKLLHVTDFLVSKLSEEFRSRVMPELKIVRTAEAEEENDYRIKDLMIVIHPLWDLIEKTHPGYDEIYKWIKDNREKLTTEPCLCVGCKQK